VGLIFWLKVDESDMLLSALLSYKRQLQTDGFVGPDATIPIDRSAMTGKPEQVAPAEINQGTRTVLDYLLSPIARISSEAGGER
jgi:hypothetical protein